APPRTRDRAGDAAAGLLDTAGVYLPPGGEPGPAPPLADRASPHRRTRHGQDHPATLRSASILAIDLRRLGEYERARRMDEDTLARSRRGVGDGPPRTLASANHLALALRRPGGDERGRRGGGDER